MTMMAEVEPPRGPFYTTAQIADMFGVVADTVRDWIKLGQLPAGKVGRSYLVHEKDLKAFTAERFGFVDEETFDNLRESTDQ